MIFTSHIALGQTTIVVARTPDAVVIGADSKLTFGDNKAVSELMCKIGVSGNVVFSAAGILENRKSSWRVMDSAMTASRMKGTLLDKVNAFEKMIVKPLLDTVKLIKQESPQIYERKVNSKDKVLLQVAFAAMENKKPTVLIRDFQLTNIAEINVIKRGCPGSCDELGVKLYHFGQDAAIKRYIANNKSLVFNAASISPFVIHLIDLEIIDKPDEVGPPIDVIKIDKNGINWVQRKNSCPAIQVRNQRK